MPEQKVGLLMDLLKVHQELELLAALLHLMVGHQVLLTGHYPMLALLVLQVHQNHLLLLLQPSLVQG